MFLDGKITFSDNNPNVTAERGVTGDGDMLQADNLKDCYKNIITARSSYCRRRI